MSNWQREPRCVEKLFCMGSPSALTEVIYVIFVLLYFVPVLIIVQMESTLARGNWDVNPGFPASSTGLVMSQHSHLLLASQSQFFSEQQTCLLDDCCPRPFPFAYVTDRPSIVLLQDFSAASYVLQLPLSWEEVVTNPRAATANLSWQSETMRRQHSHHKTEK